MEGFFSDIGLWLADAGAWEYLWAPLVMAGVAILPIPAEIPAMINGMLFGPLVGSVVTWSGAMLGAWISFEIARAWGRPLAERFVKPGALARVDSVAEEVGWWGLLVARFIPVVAFTALNWGAGLCTVPRRRFLWTTALGIAPGAVLFTTSGVGLLTVYEKSPWLAGVLVMALLGGAAYWAHRRGEDRPAES